MNFKLIYWWRFENIKNFIILALIAWKFTLVAHFFVLRVCKFIASLNHFKFLEITLLVTNKVSIIVSDPETKRQFSQQRKLDSQRLKNEGIYIESKFKRMLIIFVTPKCITTKKSIKV